MKKNLLFVFLVVCLGGYLYYFFFLRKISFPDVEYDHAAALSIDKAVLDTASDEMIENVLLPFYNNGTDGQSFLDAKGHPLHNYYSRKVLSKDILSKDILSEIHNCLSPPSASEDKTECSPIYRDIIVYYDKQDNPVGWISICFECRKIYFSPRNTSVSNSAISCLKHLFRKI